MWNQTMFFDLNVGWVLNLDKKPKTGAKIIMASMTSRQWFVVVL